MVAETEYLVRARALKIAFPDQTREMSVADMVNGFAFWDAHHALMANSPSELVLDEMQRKVE